MKARLYSAEIKIDNYHISAAEIKRFVDQQSEKSLVELIQEITKLLSERVSEIGRKSFAKTLEQLFKKRLNTIGSLSDYYQFLATNHLEHASEKNRINYSDLFPYLFFKLMIAGIKPNKQIQHLVIDEMQDYSLLQLATL